MRFPGWRKREEKKRRREETVNAIISDNASREKRARRRSKELRNGASELVMKYQSGKGKIKFVYGYKKELGTHEYYATGETIYGSNNPDYHIKEHGGVLRIIRGKKTDYGSEWAVRNDECNWPNNYRTTNHIIIETKKGITGMDNIGDKKTSVKELLSGLESDLRYMNRNLSKKEKNEVKMTEKERYGSFNCRGCGQSNRLLSNSNVLCDFCQDNSDY